MIVSNNSLMIVFAMFEDLVLPDLLTVILGFFAPLVIQFVKNRFANRTARFFISLALSAVIGIVAYVIEPPPVRDPVAFIVTVFGYATLAYKGFWKPIWEATALGNYFLKGKR
jgi:hypothetical protein